MSYSKEAWVPAKRSLGQNFLVDDNICRRIVDAVAPGPADTVVEIGPGRGALTGFMAEAGPERYLALEKDHALAAALALAHPGVEVIDGDALAYDWDSLTGGRLKIAGNLPYNVASRIIWEIVHRVAGFERAIFMVQHEVALRLAAGAGGRAYGALSVWVQSFCSVDYLFKVPPTVFRPQPKVDSAVVKFVPLPGAERPKDPEALSRLLKVCFQKRRKQLKGILKEQWSPEIEAWLASAGLTGTLRPEVLTPLQFGSLSMLI